MSGFKNISLKSKLIIIQTASAFTAVLVCCVFFVFNEIKTFKSSSLRNKYALAEIIGVNSVSPLLFMDQDSENKMLVNLKRNPTILNVVILDKNGKEFARISRKKEDPYIFPVMEGRDVMAHKFYGEKFIVSYKIFQNNDFLGTVLIRSELTDLTEIIYMDIKAASMILIAGIFAAFIISVLFQRLITRRLLLLVSKTKEVVETGNYSIRMLSDGNDEIGILSGGFNNMLEQVEKTQQALKEININLEGIVQERTADLKKTKESLQISELKYRKIVEEAGDVVYSSDAKGNFIYLNPICLRLTGYTENELVGKHFLELIDPEWKEKVAKFYKEQFEKRVPETLYSFPIRTKSGEKKWVEQTVTEQIKDDRVIGHYAIVRDITERVKIEKEIQLKSEELTNTNKELEQFVYVASHDLQEPLRTISNFVGLLEKKYAGITDKDSGQYLKFIVQATNRMRNLIKDLLDLSRIGRNVTVDVVDCNEILKDVLANLEGSIKECDAKITIVSLPVLKGNPSELKQLFQNLISNAIKFRRKNIVPEIFINVEEKNSEYLFSISDNGIGIEEQYIGKLFVIFQRLNTAAEYSGTGIGLATCKKIVSLHSGKIWVESKFGEGSTFYFTLSKELESK